MNVLITITSAGASYTGSSTFSITALPSNTVVATGVSLTALQAGYTAAVPIGTTSVTVQSTNPLIGCVNNVTVSVLVPTTTSTTTAGPTTTTTSGPTTTTTAGPTTTTTSGPTTTTTAGPTTTTTTTTEAPTCTDWYNNSGSPQEVTYTDCNGTFHTAYNILAGQSVCAQDGQISGPGFGFLLNNGACIS